MAAYGITLALLGKYRQIIIAQWPASVAQLECYCLGDSPWLKAVGRGQERKTLDSLCLPSFVYI